MMDESKISCVVCENLLAKELLWDHVGGEHLNYRPFNCSTCHEKFLSEAELAVHVIDSIGHIGDYVFIFGVKFILIANKKTL